jgi:two-component system, NarL family, response regulator DevR
MPLRVMLVDDHEVVRNGIKSLLHEAPAIRVVAEAGSVKEAIEGALWARPDVVVMDIRLTDGSGIEATREIHARLPKTRVLMLTTYADDEALFASIMAGAAGYVLKQIKGGDLLRAIRAVGSGESLLDPAITAGLLDRLRKGKHLLMDERLARLSAQEERIQNQSQNRRPAAPGRKDGQELPLEHPAQARGGPPCRSRRLPGSPHRPTRQQRLTALRERTGVLRHRVCAGIARGSRLPPHPGHAREWRVDRQGAAVAGRMASRRRDDRLGAIQASPTS